MSARSVISGSLTVGLLFAFCACGGDNGGDTLTKDEWISKAEAVCADMIAQEDEIAEPQSLEDMRAASDQLDTIIRTGLDDLRALPPPEEDQDTVIEILAAFENLADAGDDFVDAVVESGSIDDMTDEVELAFANLETAQQQAKEIAEAYGLTGCFPE